MNLMILVGLLVGVGSIYFGIPELRDSLMVYLDPNSFILVAGGTLACTIISSTFTDFKAVMSVLTGWMYMKRKSSSHYKTVLKLIEISEAATKNGKGSVLEMGDGFGDGFLKRSLALMGTGLEEDFVRQSLETDINEERRRHMRCGSLVRSMGSFAPMFGMMGTVMGVMQVLRNISDVDSIVSGMALALLTTLYGLILSSLFFIPVTNKLRFLSEEDALTKQIIMEGVISVMQDQIPLKVEKKLMAYVSTKIQSKADKEKGL